MENYFEYFTEIEECFRRCRGTPTLLSTLDWALIDSWKEGGIPLAAVRAGIERAFEKYARRPARFRKINALAYCTQSVLEAADEMKEGSMDRARRPSPGTAEPVPFTLGQLHSYFRANAEALRRAARICRDRTETPLERGLVEDFEAAAGTLDSLTAETCVAPANTESLERQLTALEEKLAAAITRACPAERLVELHLEVDRGTAPYRNKMTGPQLESLTRQFLKRSLYEHYGVPRLSLFYVTASIGA